MYIDASCVHVTCVADAAESGEERARADILARFELPNFGLVTTSTYPTDFAQLSKNQCPES